MYADYGRNLDRDGAASGVFILSRAREQMLLDMQNGARIAIHRPETASAAAGRRHAQRGEPVSR